MSQRVTLSLPSGCVYATTLADDASPCPKATARPPTLTIGRGVSRPERPKRSTRPDWNTFIPYVPVELREILTAALGVCFSSQLRTALRARAGGISRRDRSFQTQMHPAPFPATKNPLDAPAKAVTGVFVCWRAIDTESLKRVEMHLVFPDNQDSLDTYNVRRTKIARQRSTPEAEPAPAVGRGLTR